MKRLSLILIAMFALNAWAAGDLTQEMDALGANKDLMKKAKAIDPNNRVRVVQNREVDRNLRLEIGVNYGMTAGGNDPYVNTSSLGGQLDFHVNPHWSVGARYSAISNSLNAEGKKVFEDAARSPTDPTRRNPDVAYAKDSWLVVTDFYPVYGKMNLFDSSIAQFDVYLIGGAGQINLETGSTPLYTAGAGVGIWLSKHVTTRFEARWQGYQDKVWDGANDITRSRNETVMTASIGFIL